LNVQTKRIQPYSSSDGNYVALTDFIIENAHHLYSDFKPTFQWSERNTERVQSDRDVTRFTFGGPDEGMNIVHKVGYEPEAQSHAEDEVSVTCFGFPEGMRLELQAVRHNSAPRYIEIHTGGPEDAVKIVLDRFSSRFTMDFNIEDTQLRDLIGTARAAIRVHAWRAAEYNAYEILKHVPDHPDAMMFLGIAKAALGYDAEGEGLLLASLTLNPKNHDAYYNLGLLTMKQGRYTFACDAFKHGLKSEPTNHALLFQLGQSLETIGNLEESLESFRKAMQYSPGPYQAWSNANMDFAREVKEAIARVQDAIENNKKLD